MFNDMMCSDTGANERTVDCDVMQKKTRTIKNKKLYFFRHTYFGFVSDLGCGIPGIEYFLRFFLLFRSVRFRIFKVDRHFF